LTSTVRQPAQPLASLSVPVAQVAQAAATLGLAVPYTMVTSEGGAG